MQLQFRLRVWQICESFFETVEMNFPDLEKGQKNFRLRSIFRPQSIFRRLFVSLGGRLMKWSSWKTQIYWIRFLFETNSHQFARTKAAWKTATYLKRDKKAEVAAAAFVSPPSSTQPNHSSSSANSPRSLVILSHVQHAPPTTSKSFVRIEYRRLKSLLIASSPRDVSRWPTNFSGITWIERGSLAVSARPRLEITFPHFSIDRPRQSRRKTTWNHFRQQDKSCSWNNEDVRDN